MILPIGYSHYVQNPGEIVKFLTSWAQSWTIPSLYNYAIAIFMARNILAAVLFFFPPVRKYMEISNSCIIILILWWAQPKLYVGRGMHEDTCSLLKYTMFWILLLICKLAFSFYAEILPLVGPTKQIWQLRVGTYDWHEFFPNGCSGGAEEHCKILTSVE